MIPVVLVLLVVGSALGVIYQNNVCRDVFLEIQRLEMELEHTAIESGQLLLERTTLAGYAKIERDARLKIGLVQPGHESIVYLKTPLVKGVKIDD